MQPFAAAALVFGPNLDAGCLSEVLKGPGRHFRGVAAKALPDAALAWLDAHDAASRRPWTE